MKTVESNSKSVMQSPPSLVEEGGSQAPSSFLQALWPRESVAQVELVVKQKMPAALDRHAASGYNKSRKG